MIDVSRHNYETEESFLKYFGKLRAHLKNRDGPGHSYRPLQLGNGLDYAKEYPDLALEINTNVVAHPSNCDDRNSRKILILPKVWEHPRKRYPDKKYGMLRLKGSIGNILREAFGPDKKDQLMENLRT